MSPRSQRARAFAARLAQDDAFRTLAVEDTRAALAEYDLSDEPGLIPEAVTLPLPEDLRALGLDKKPEPKPPPPPEPTTPVHAQLFDPE